MISRREIAAARAAIASRIRYTPIIRVKVDRLDVPVSIKLECLQYAGSFKVRGAFANLLGSDVPKAGVTAASGGNHGAAVAYAAATLGLKAMIFVPAATPAAKVARIRSYQAEVMEGGANYVEAFLRSERYAAETGARAIHAYDSERTITGQGTVAQEIEEQAPDLDTVLVAVGGGGLVAGVASWFAGGPKVVGIETEGCPTLHTAMAKGRPVDIVPSGVAMDSLGASRAGAIAFEIAQAHLHEVLLVPDPTVRLAQRWLWENLRIITEPGGAVPFAALHSGAYRPLAGEHVCVLACGANVDLSAFASSILE